MKIVLDYICKIILIDVSVLVICGILRLRICCSWLIIISIVDFVVKLLISGFDRNVVIKFSLVVFMLI